MTFGSLVVISEAGTNKWGNVRWLCKCQCGADHEAAGGKLRSGGVTSCGCAKPAACAAANIVHGDSARGKMTAEYRAWSNAIDRCERSSNKSFKYWGGRGISMCPRWRENFANFLADMGRKPSPAHMIDRIDNNGNYEPGNCRWATRKEQMRNRRNRRSITVEDRTMCLAEWSEEAGIKVSTIWQRLRNGWAPERAVTEPARAKID